MDADERQGIHRAALGLAVLAAHLGLIVLVLHGTTSTAKPPAEAPILVALLPDSPRTPENLSLPRPVLTQTRPIVLAPPEFTLLTEHSDARSTAVAAVSTAQPPPAASSPQPSPGPTLQTMSTVAYVQRPVPTYPRESRLAHEEGLVVLRVLIDESGRARDIDIYQSSGHPRLDQEARNAVARALFKPYLDGGVAKAAIAMVPIEFSLRGRSS